MGKFHLPRLGELLERAVSPTACSSTRPTPGATRSTIPRPTCSAPYLTPRRPEDSTNLALDRSSSALDHRQRFTFEALYDLPFFKHSNWFMKNVVGNWEFAPVYTYQTGTSVDVQSGVDSNLNADSAGDRAFVNPAGAGERGLRRDGADEQLR